MSAVFFKKSADTCGHPADTLRTKPEDKCPQALLVCPQYVLRVRSMSAVCPSCPQCVLSVSAGMSAGMSLNEWIFCPLWVLRMSFVCPSCVRRCPSFVLRLSFVCPSLYSLNEWINLQKMQKWMNLSESVWICLKIDNLSHTVQPPPLFNQRLSLCSVDLSFESLLSPSVRELVPHLASHLFLSKIFGPVAFSRGGGTSSLLAPQT